jgi:parallel beta-helix repeat protein
MDASATDGASKSETTQGVTYDPEEHTILVEAPAETSLGAVAAALGQPDLLAEIGPGEWLLSANLEISPGATLVIAGPEVRWLKLRSDDEGFVSLKARGGRLLLDNTCVSSWDPGRSQVDENVTDGRSFVLARDGAWMAIRRSRLHHLGYQANESYGLAWRLKGTGGEIIDSELAYNFYGLYSYQVEGLVIRGNVVRHSVLYGIDPHTASNRLVIEDNLSHHNGKHGIILAEGCSDSVIRNNVAYANQLHGIVLYNGSNNNLVEGNTVYDNGLQGINLNRASDNRVLDNTVYGNGSDGIGLGRGSADNLIAGNLVRDNRAHGIYLFTEARSNIVAENRVSGNGRYGIYAKSAGNRVMAGNHTTGNTVGIVVRAEDLADDARGPAQRSTNREHGLRLIDD